MKTEELNDYICRLAEFFAKPRSPKDSESRWSDTFTAEGIEFYLQESTWYSRADRCMTRALTVYPPIKEMDMQSVSVKYSVIGRPEDDLESRVKACMCLAWDFISIVLSRLNTELLIAVRNEEVERTLAELE